MRQIGLDIRLDSMLDSSKSRYPHVVVKAEPSQQGSQSLKKVRYRLDTG